MATQFVIDGGHGVPAIEIVSEGVPVQGEEIWVCGPEVMELRQCFGGIDQHFMAKSCIFNESSVLVDADD